MVPAALGRLIRPLPERRLSESLRNSSHSRLSGCSGWTPVALSISWKALRIVEKPML